MRLVCNCGAEFTVLSNHGRWITCIKPGEPYQVYHTDVLACKTCSNTIMRTAEQPVAMHFEQDFDHTVEDTRQMEFCWEE